MSDESDGADRMHPDRGAFFIVRRSRHEVPKTPVTGDTPYIYDPDRVSLHRATLHHDRPLAGSRGKGSDNFPGVVGANAPPTPGL